MSSDQRHYFKELRLQQFRGLVAVVETESFSLAADRLALTKASVWQQVRALEEEFGCVLIESKGRKVKPTAHGIKLAQLAAPLVEGFDSIKSAFLADLQQTPASLRIATTPSCISHELRNAIAKTRALFPDAHLTFLDRNSPAAIDLLDAGEADLAVAARFDDWPEKTALDFLQINRHPFAIAAQPGHPILSQKNPKLSHLADYPILLPGQTANCRPRLERIFRNAGLWDRLKIVLECSFPGSLHQYVEAGLGIALSPVPPALLSKQPALNSKRANLRQPIILRDLSALLGFEPVFLIRRRGWVETPIAKAFQAALLHDKNLA